VQYTLRYVPVALDRALRERARREGMSLHEVTIDLLRDALGLGGKPLRHRSLRDVRGMWQDDAAFEKRFPIRIARVPAEGRRL
jgi:hypothetical protein